MQRSTKHTYKTKDRVTLIALLSSSVMHSCLTFYKQDECVSRYPCQDLLLQITQHKKNCTNLYSKRFDYGWNVHMQNLFATSINHRLETYVSAVPDIKLKRWMSCQSVGQNILHFVTSFRFLSLVLQKITTDNCIFFIIFIAQMQQNNF